MFTFTKPLGVVFVGQQITFRLQGLKFHLCTFVAQLAIAARKTECLAPISLDLDQSAKQTFKLNATFSIIFSLFSKTVAYAMACFLVVIVKANNINLES